MSTSERPKSIAGRAATRFKAAVRPASGNGQAAKQNEKKKKKKAPGTVGKMLHQPGVKPLVISLGILLLVYLATQLILRPASPGQHIDLNRLVTSADNGDLQTAEFLDQDSRITGKFFADNGSTETYWTAYPSSDATTNDLINKFIANDVAVNVDSQSFKAMVRSFGQFILPLVIFANLFALLFLLVRGGGGASEFTTFSELGDKQLGSAEKTRVNFSNVAAADEAVIEMAEVRDYLIAPESFAAMGALPPKGVLIMGPPGTGKTLLARAVAGEAKASFYSISGSNFVESLVGVGAARVRDLFRQARENSPALIFIDELDAVGRQRGAGLGGGHDEREQTLNEMLVQMDGFSPSEGVAVLAATNRPDILDPALMRAGRFDRHITLDRPDRDGRLAILKLHAKGKRLADPDRDLPQIARNTPGFTGADLANLLNEAALLAVRERAQTITRRHLDEAIDRVVSGPRRKGTLMPEEEKRRVAYHEAGHAVVAAALGKRHLLQKMSIVARGRGMGHLALLSEEREVMTRHDIEFDIAIAMGGLAAEEFALGDTSTGSEVDLERATEAARDMAGRYGMSPRLGRARVLKQQGEVFLGRDYMAATEISHTTLEKLDAEVESILAEQEAVACSILAANRQILDRLATTLIIDETIQGDELESALARVIPFTNGQQPSQQRAGRTGAGDRPWQAPAAQAPPPAAAEVAPAPGDLPPAPPPAPPADTPTGRNSPVEDEERTGQFAPVRDEDVADESAADPEPPDDEGGSEEASSELQWLAQASEVLEKMEPPDILQTPDPGTATDEDVADVADLEGNGDTRADPDDNGSSRRRNRGRKSDGWSRWRE